MKKILIGTGSLSWLAGERRSDRYGTVSLFGVNSLSESITSSPVIITKGAIESYLGKYGEFKCKVLETRQSTHIGDLFHGFNPSTPKEGAIIKLGEGFLFYEFKENTDCFGLKPKEQRNYFWLKPKQLYKVHEQTVNLYFIPK